MLEKISAPDLSACPSVPVLGVELPFELRNTECGDVAEPEREFKDPTEAVEAGRGLRIGVLATGLTTALPVSYLRANLPSTSRTTEGV